MKNSTLSIFNDLFVRYPALSSEKDNIKNAFDILSSVYLNGGKILVCGNGGSASDSEHIVGELMKKFRKRRPIDKQLFNDLAKFGTDGEKLQNTLEGTIPAISLTSHIALSTAFSNDKEPSVVFAQQLLGLGNRGDALISISTSGNSENCVLTTVLAKSLGIKTISLTGKNQSKLSALSDVTIFAPESETYKIQEFHLPVYHTLCAMLEEEFF